MDMYSGNSSSSMMIFIVIAVCCLSMIGGGIGAYFLFSDSGTSDKGTSDKSTSGSKKQEENKKQEESIVDKIQFTTSTTKLTPEQQKKADELRKEIMEKAEEVARKVKPTNCNNMINDPNYKNIIDAYDKNGKFDDGQRNTAIVIVSKLYYPLNNKKQNLIQMLPDKTLYNLLKRTICNTMSKDRNYNEVINTFYTQWDTTIRSKAINLLKSNMSGIKPENLTNGQLYYILLGESQTTSTYPVVTDTCRQDGQPCSAYLESSDGMSSAFLDQVTGAYTIFTKDNNSYVFWSADSSSTKNMPYYSKIDTDNELKVFDANDKKISGTDIGGLTEPNQIQMRNQGDLILRDPKNNYNIWTAYNGGSGKIK